MITDPMVKGVNLSDGMIGGIVGGLLFLLVTVILAVIAVKIFNKRKQRERAMRYGESVHVADILHTSYFVAIFGSNSLL